LYDNAWHLWSWTCCPGNLTWHSPDIAGFLPGEVIYGSIERLDSITWKIDSAWNDGGVWKNTTLIS